jgi:hypothetical protein
MGRRGDLSYLLLAVASGNIDAVRHTGVLRRLVRKTPVAAADGEIRHYADIMRLRRFTPAKPANALPNSQTAPGTGTGVWLMVNS